MRLADALGWPVSSLMEDARKEPVVVVDAGETTVFAADVPHAYEGAGRGPCELMMTVPCRWSNRDA